MQSVSFEQDKKALQAGAQQAALVAGEETESVKLPENGKPPVHKEKARKPAGDEPREEGAKQKPEPKSKTKGNKKPEEKPENPYEFKPYDFNHTNV